jgi:exonuclease SbcC
MRIDKLTLRGFTTFKEEQSLDFAALGPGLIAIVGPNGAGKSTLLESIPGGIYRQAPSRGNVANLANARDAHIELIGENGSPFIIRLDVDSHTGKSEAVLLDGAGEPLAGPKVRDFDRAIEEKFPAYNVYLAAAFACQTGAGSLFKMDRAERRELFGRLLGTDRHEALATAAREKGRKIEEELVSIRAALEAVKDGAGDIKALKSVLAEAQEKSAAAKVASKEAAERYRAAIVERDRLVLLASQAEEAAKKATEADLKLLSAEHNLHFLEAQAKNLEPLLSKAAEIRAAAAKLIAVRAELTSLEGQTSAAYAEMSKAQKRFTAALDANRVRALEVSNLQEKIKALDAVLKDGAAIRKVAAELEELHAEADRTREAGEAAALAEREAVEASNEAERSEIKAEQTFKNCERAIADAQEKRDLATKKKALALLSTGTVPCAGSLSDDQRRGCSALLGHFKNKEEAEAEIEAIEAHTGDREKLLQIASEECKKRTQKFNQVNAERTAAGEKTANLRLAYRTIKEQIDQLQKKDRLHDLHQAEAQAGALRPSLEATENALAESKAALELAQKEMDAASQSYKEIAQHKVATDAAHDQLNGATDRLRALELAESEAATIKGRLEAARPAVQAAADEAEKAKAAVVSVDQEKILDAAAEVEESENDANAADLTANTATYKAAQVEADLKAAIEAQKKAEELKAKIAPLEQDAADYRFLARGLGREGVQALELDAAGPQVSTLANELLANSYGSRFQVRLETQAALANGKGVKETFDFIVVDNERGREGNGEDLSGGEKVIVGEALGLAVGLFHSRAAGVNIETVVRDETVGALDPENAERYIAMLKSFIKIGRVSQLLFVAHSPALIDMADAVVTIENGRINVR